MSNSKHSQDAKDRYFMMLAIEQAKRGLYTTRPNPAVGCVIVQADKVVGQGFHPKAGQPHAEVFALKDAGTRAIGATAATSSLSSGPRISLLPSATACRAAAAAPSAVS